MAVVKSKKVKGGLIPAVSIFCLRYPAHDAPPLSRSPSVHLDPLSESVRWGDVYSPPVALLLKIEAIMAAVTLFRLFPDVDGLKLFVRVPTVSRIPSTFARPKIIPIFQDRKHSPATVGMCFDPRTDYLFRPFSPIISNREASVCRRSFLSTIRSTIPCWRRYSARWNPSEALLESFP